jgi:hypothetical protein
MVINGIVKSGGNDFHGTGFLRAGQELRSSNIDDDLRAQGITVGDDSTRERTCPETLRPDHPKQAVVLWRRAPADPTKQPRVLPAER